MVKSSLLKADNWPISKSELINKNLKQFNLNGGRGRATSMWVITLLVPAL